MSGIILPIVFILLGFSLHFGECLHCWECNSKYDPNCGDPFKNHTIALTDCSQRFLKGDLSVPASICRRITQTVRGEVRVIRSCGFYNPEDAGSCVNRAGTHQVYMHYCQCAGDRCNTSTPLQYPTFWHLAVVVTLLLSILS